LTDESLDASERMLDRITGDNPPALDTWAPQDWITLQANFNRLRVLVERERSILPKVRELLSAERDYEWNLRKPRSHSKYGRDNHAELVDAARRRRDRLLKELGL
jgi:hypothetical protein